MEMKAEEKVLDWTMANSLPGSGWSPAPTMPTIPATMMLSTLETDNQESPSNVLGNEQIRVGIAKMPVYSIVQSLLSLRDASAI